MSDVKFLYINKTNYHQTDNMLFISLVFCLHLYFLKSVDGDKSRFWMGPTNFLGGNLPTARQGHGVISIENKKLVLFGGTNSFFGKKTIYLLCD